jgi:uncharacterized protein YeaO (DUF488 family)
MATHDDRRVDYGRVYDPPAGDAARVLVDRLWPRGLRRDDAPFDEWCKDVAPSTELRRWYAHDPDRYAEFARRYRDELARPECVAALHRLRELAARRGLVLLTATKDVEISAARVLADVLTE